MWDLPGPGLEPVAPALAGGFSTTAPPGKSHFTYIKLVVELSMNFSLHTNIRLRTLRNGDRLQPYLCPERLAHSRHAIHSFKKIFMEILLRATHCPDAEVAVMNQTDKIPAL